jgi:hypothetical protein
MLHPHGNRQLLFEALRPPPGSTLDSAIGTTFSLDLLTLLTAPLAFTSFDLEDAQGRIIANPLALLESLRRYADRISIFCQAGQIALPGRYDRLYTYLEQTVHEVVAPDPDGVFHPKLWVLRFTSVDAPEQPACYRVLCLSRNLTTDRSWDTILVLDGTMQATHPHKDANQPLCDFVAALPTLAMQPLAEQAMAHIARMREELPSVVFDLPTGFDGLTFWPLGIEGHTTWPFPRTVDRMLVMAPFVSGSCLTRLAGTRQNNILIARPEELHPLRAEQLAGFAQVFVLDPTMQTEMAETAGADGTDPPADSADALVGLHAKLYLADQGPRAHIWTGSANATHAAFHHNVEFLVELAGAREHCGSEALLRRTDEDDLIDMLQPFLPPTEPATPDPVQQLAHRAETARAVLARAPFTVQVETIDDDDRFQMYLCLPDTSRLDLPDGVQVHCWPITVAEAMAHTFDDTTRPVATFGPISFAALTPFIAFAVVASDGTHTARCRFVRNLPLLGAPEDRPDQIIRDMFANSKDMLRFLLFLLADSGADVAPDILRPHAQQNGHHDTHTNGAMPGFSPVFEALVRALDRNPARLDEIHRLIHDLPRTAEGDDLLPNGFDAIWQPIWTARERLRS